MVAHDALLGAAGGGPGVGAVRVLPCTRMLKRGELIGGRYRLIEPLASGGMGTVWRAEHVELNAQVALKVMLADSARTPSGERRFRREAQAAARLRSPHVVHVQDFGVHEEQPYLAMELLQGEDLESRLETRGKLPPEACATILDGVAKAIDLAHAHGITHRDLKPANIFLAKDGDAEVVKVLDFGVAKVETSNAASTTGAGLVGSPAYMSPEQVWGEGVTASTDLWSLGVVALEMLTGENPFDAGPLAKVFDRIVREDLPRVNDLLPDAPAGLQGFFDRALARDVDERFSSAAELAGAFRRALAGEAPTARPRSTIPPRPAAEGNPRRAVDPHAATLDGAAPATWSRRAMAATLAGALATAAAVIFLASRSPTPRLDAPARADRSSAETVARPPSPSAPPERSERPVFGAASSVSAEAPSSAAASVTAEPSTQGTAEIAASARPPPLPNAGPAASAGGAVTLPPSAAPPSATAAASASAKRPDPLFGIPQ